MTAWTERELRVPCFVREHTDVDPDLAQRPRILFLDIAAEDQIGIGITMQPAIVLDFAFELACGPAGIAQRQDRMLRPRALGDRLENIDRGGQANLVVDPQCRILNEKIARMQYEATTGLDRAALEHLQGLGVLRQLDLVGLLDDVELDQQAGKIDAARRTVNDDSHGAFRRMRAEINHGTFEARVTHDGHGDQQLAIEIAMALGCTDAGNFAATRSRSFAFRAHRQRLAWMIY